MRGKIISILGVLSLFIGCSSSTLQSIDKADFSYKDSLSKKESQHGDLGNNPFAVNEAEVPLHLEETYDSNSSNQGDQYENKSIVDGDNSNFQLISENGKSSDVKDEIKSSKENKEVPSISPYAYTDQNEDNDSFDTASTVLGVNQSSSGYYGLDIWWWATISQKLGFLWIPYIDKDFYSYDVVMNGTLTVSLTNIPAGCDYDLKIFKMGNSYNSKAVDSYQVGISQGASNANESVTLSVTPGTYFAEVYSFSDKYFNNDVPYEIEFSIRDGRSYSDGHKSISSAMSSGKKGMIWKSDYKPFGVSPTSLSSDESKYYFDNYNEYPLIRHLADKYNTSTGKDVTYEILYVWDKSLRIAIYSIAQALLLQLDSYDEWQANTQNIVQIVFEGTDVSLVVADITVTTLGILGIAAAALSTAGIVVTSVSALVTIGEIIYSHLAPAPFNVTKNDLREYLINLKSAMEVGRGTSDKEVVMMRFRYHFDHEFWGDKHYLDYHQLYRNNDTNLYNVDVIDFYNSESPFNGSISAINSNGDLSWML